MIKSPTDFDVSTLPTLRMPKVTKRLPVVAQESVQEAAVIERRLQAVTVRTTPAPDVLATAHKPVYHVWIDGKQQPDLCDLDGVDLLVGRSLRLGAHYIEVYRDEERLYEVRNGSEGHHE